MCGVPTNSFIRIYVVVRTRRYPLSLTRTAGNYVHDNGDAGLAMMESFDAKVSDNIFENNKYGVRISVGCGRNVFSNNVISGSTK